MKITLVTEDTTADAIRGVCYVRAWTISELARRIGASNSDLSHILHGRREGSEKMRQRILSQMPAGVLVSPRTKKKQEE